MIGLSRSLLCYIVVEGLSSCRVMKGREGVDILDVRSSMLAESPDCRKNKVNSSLAACVHCSMADAHGVKKETSTGQQQSYCIGFG